MWNKALKVGRNLAVAGLGLLPSSLSAQTDSFQQLRDDVSAFASNFSEQLRQTASQADEGTEFRTRLVIDAISEDCDNLTTNPNSIDNCIGQLYIADNDAAGSRNRHILHPLRDRWRELAGVPPIADVLQFAPITWPLGVYNDALIPAISQMRAACDTIDNRDDTLACAGASLQASLTLSDLVRTGYESINWSRQSQIISDSCTEPLTQDFSGALERRLPDMIDAMNDCNAAIHATNYNGNPFYRQSTDVNLYANPDVVIRGLVEVDAASWRLEQLAQFQNSPFPKPTDL